MFPDGARFSADNLVLHARGRKHSVNGFGGPLSIKTVIQGEVTWQLERGPVTVDERSFLVLREGDKYWLDIDEPHAVETCCVFFQAGFAEQVIQDATTPLDDSLDNPGRTSPALPLLSYLQPDAEGRLLPDIRTLARRCSGQLAPSASEEAFLAVAARLLLFFNQLQTQIARLPAVKAGTREELFRRLLLAREYVHGHTAGPLSLDSVARAACLSRYHFHRAFTGVFRCTPHAYITDLRLARAHTLLRKGFPVTQACGDVGFSSASSFSRLFRRRFGAAPSEISKIRTASGTA